MKSSVFKTVAIIFAILGIIGGIVNGNQALDGFSFLTMIYTWIETALFVLIFYGIGTILEHLEDLKAMERAKSEKVKILKKDFNENRTPSHNEWKCPNCGKINQNYVGSGGCGTPKPKNDKWECPNCHTMNTYSDDPECKKCHWKP